MSTNIDDPNFDPNKFIAEYNSYRSGDIKDSVTDEWVSGRVVEVLDNPNEYSLNLYLEDNSFNKVGSINAWSFVGKRSISFRDFNISPSERVLLVKYQLNIDVYTSSPLQG